jgi:hypothetical protein
MMSCSDVLFPIFESYHCCTCFGLRGDQAGEGWGGGYIKILMVSSENVDGTIQGRQSVNHRLVFDRPKWLFNSV